MCVNSRIVKNTLSYRSPPGDPRNRCRDICSSRREGTSSSSHANTQTFGGGGSKLTARTRIGDSWNEYAHEMSAPDDATLRYTILSHAVKDLINFEGV